MLIFCNNEFWYLSCYAPSKYFMNRTSEKDFTTIIKQCIDGNRKSQKELYILISSEMFAICLCNAKNRHDAENLLAEGFIKVLNTIHLYQGEVHFIEWCSSIFSKAAREYYLNKNSNHNYC